MSGKIETGCQAVIVNSKAGNNGIEVTVGKFIGEVLGYAYSDRWEIDKAIKSIYEIGGGAAGTAEHCSERELRRIDFNGREITSWDALSDIFIPEDLKEKA